MAQDLNMAEANRISNYIIKGLPILLMYTTEFPAEKAVCTIRAYRLTKFWRKFQITVKTLHSLMPIE